jgi:hypothetical protein
VTSPCFTKISSNLPSLAYISNPLTVSKQKLKTFLKSQFAELFMESSKSLKNTYKLQADTVKATSGFLIANMLKLPFSKVSKKQLSFSC